MPVATTVERSISLADTLLDSAVARFADEAHLGVADVGVGVGEGRGDLVKVSR